MARYRESSCRLCRREGMKLYLKGERCFGDKCSIERRNYPPGQHGQARAKFSEYGVQLREKQKVKRVYGMVEKQFKLTFQEAARQKGITGENLIRLLERRLDNMVYRLGFGSSRAQARMLVSHGHITVNGKCVDIPSYLVKKGDKIAVHEKSKKIALIQSNVETAERRGIPRWLSLDASKLEGTVLDYPAREEITMPIQEQLIVELYSK